MSDLHSPHRKILVPVDGSDSATRACDYAIDLARNSGGVIVFIHVIEVPPIAPYRFRPTSRALAYFEEQGKRILSDCERRARSLGVRTENKILSHGDAAANILRACEREGCDSIVIGKTGKGRVQKLLIGSVGDEVSKLSRVPVVLAE